MALLSVHNLTHSHGGPNLLENASLNIEEGERVALVGCNGAGKSTLMRLLADEYLPDSGEIAVQKGARIARLPQEVPENLTGEVNQIVADSAPDDIRAHEINAVITRLGLDGEADLAELSGGMRRRVLLARALASQPDLLLLDEPTNHLDIESIQWLEEFLPRAAKSLLFVTHDRTFLQKLATRIVEIDRGRLVSYDCNYATYLERKAASLEAEAAQNANFDKKLAEEEVWIRRGLKARRTRDEGRVRALLRMREERSRRRNQTGAARLNMQDAKKSGRLVIEAENVNFGYDEKIIVRDFSTTILRGDKVGLIGANGSGKTTLLRLLLKDLAPQTGVVRHGTKLDIAYFDQMRGQLDEAKTVWQNVAGDNDTVEFNGQRRHIVGYLGDFLFSRERARSPVSVLSGGERNRLLLAKLFTQPANLLVMDEPTNDLDIETLDLLEELLTEYSGTLLLVSHDRTFLNNVVTSVLAPDGDGQWNEYVGGYDDWLRAPPKPTESTPVPADKPRAAKSTPVPVRPRKLNFKEKQELKKLPALIESLETEQKKLYETLSDPAFYQNGGDAAAAKTRLDELETEHAAAFAKWEELEELAE